MSHLANKFDVRSELYGKVSLAAVNQILCLPRGYEPIQNSKDSLKAFFSKRKYYANAPCFRIPFSDNTNMTYASSEEAYICLVVNADKLSGKAPKYTKGIFNLLF